jgi:hypothetical protein
MSLESAAIKMSAHHPFRSAKAKEQYLKLYDMRAKEWPVASETGMVNTAYGPTFVRVSGSCSTRRSCYCMESVATRFSGCPSFKPEPEFGPGGP